MSEPMASAPAPIAMTPTTAPTTTSASDPSSTTQPGPGESSPREGEEIAAARAQGQTQAQETFTGTAEPETLSPSLAKTDDMGAEGGEGQGTGKLPFKEQVKAYAKVHRGTILGDKEQKATGQKILSGELSPDAVSGTNK